MTPFHLRNTIVGDIPFLARDAYLTCVLVGILVAALVVAVVNVFLVAVRI